MDTSGILLAAGQGRRLGKEEGKAFLLLAGKPLLSWCGQAFAVSGVVEELVVVVSPGREAQAEEVLADLPLVCKFACGGERRQDSAWAGLSAAGGNWVLIHDVARPLASAELIRRVLQSARLHGAAVPVWPEVDTVRRVAGDFLAPGTVERAGLVRIQTPQAFQRGLLVEAYRGAREKGLELPDDAAAVLALGRRVATVPGEPWNLKLTYPEDWEVLRALAKSLPACSRETR